MAEDQERATGPRAGAARRPLAGGSARKMASKECGRGAASKPQAKGGVAARGPAKGADAKTKATKIVTKGAAVKAPPARARKRATPAEALAMLEALHAIHPDAHCELDHDGPFQLLCATVLSAQTTDVAVNKATPKLFARFPDAKTLAAAEPAEVEPYVSTLGFFRQKSKSLVGLARSLVASHGGQVPSTLDELVKLPGVGRKTANVVLGVVFHSPEGVVVDTHVQRLTQRLGWTKNDEPVGIEQDLMKLLPRDRWDITSHVLIFHGRRVCFARKPSCDACGVSDRCPNAFHAEHVGRKPPRPARPS